MVMTCVLCSSALAQTGDLPGAEPLVLTDAQGEYPLGTHLDILEDPGGELTIEDVSSLEFDSQFVQSQAAVPNYGFTDSVYWVRLRLNNQAQRTSEWLLEQSFANLHYVDLYTPLPGGEGFAVKQTGILRPASTRDFLHTHILFNLTVPPQSRQTYYLRLQSGGSMTLALTLWTPAVFLNYSLFEKTLMGVVFGVLLGLLLYNLFLLFNLREANYLYFVILIASLMFEELSYDGYLRIYFFPNLIRGFQYFEPLAFALLIGSMVLFADSFLELKRRLPKLHIASSVILAVWGALVLLIPFSSYHLMANLMVPWSVVSLIVVFIAGIATWLGGYRPSRFFMLAWVGLIISLLWLFLVRLGLTPSSILSENAFRAGYLWMAVCWSIALADRISVLKAETERVNRDLRSSERRLSQILEGLPLGVVVYGKDQKPNYVNKRTVEILSNPATNIQVDPSAERTIAQALQYFSFRVAGSNLEYPLENLPVYSALQGKPASADDVEADLGSRRVPLEIWSSPIRDDAGNVESAVTAFQDITQRKQAEMAQQISETRFRVIAENNFDGIAFMGRNREVLYVSPSYQQLVGKTAEEMIGQSGIGFVHPDDRDYTAKTFFKLLQQPNTRISAEYRIPHKDGSFIWVETFGINLLDNPYVQAIVLNSHDITDRKRVEAELVEYRKHLESLVDQRTIELSNVNEQLELRLEWLSAVNMISQIMARSADFDLIYEKIVEIIKDIFDSDAAFIAELLPGGDQVKILVHSDREEFKPIFTGTLISLPESILSASNPKEPQIAYLSPDQINKINGPIGLHLRDSGITCMVCIPLILREQVFGCLGLEMQEECRHISDEESVLLRIFSTDIAQLIEDSNLFEQSKAMIAAEERNRLARDLHDSVTQVLFSASLLADVLPQIWRRDPEQGLQRLEKLRWLTRGALAEMRTMLLELRPKAVINSPLGDLLGQLTEATSSRSGLKIQLYIEKIPPLPEEVHTAFYRIAQEALNNAVKHAQARLVTLSLSTTTLPPERTGSASQAVKLTIQDDGVGFSPGDRGATHLGLSIMRERAAAIQANLTIESQPGYGTQMTLIWNSENGRLS
jgi:PAS domain S-box-containing protein